MPVKTWAGVLFAPLPVWVESLFRWPARHLRRTPKPLMRLDLKGNDVPEKVEKQGPKLSGSMSARKPVNMSVDFTKTDIREKVRKQGDDRCSGHSF